MPAANTSNMGVASKGEKGKGSELIELDEKSQADLDNQIKWLHDNWRRGMRAADISRHLSPATRRSFKGMIGFVAHMKAICDNEGLDWVDVIVGGRVHTVIFSVKE